MLYEGSWKARLGKKEFYKTVGRGQHKVTYIRPKIRGLGLKGPWIRKQQDPIRIRVSIFLTQQ